MTFSERMAAATVLVLLAGCGGGGGGGSTNNQATGGGSGQNVLQLSVNGVRCSGGAYANQPCVQVTVCQPGTSTCITVDDVLLDTGSYGLRIFKQALSGLTLPPVAAGSGNLATCVQFADLSSDWGPVQVADVILGGEPAVEVPIHVLDSTFGPPPSACPGPESGPSVAGFNGILGVGVFASDCGGGCAAAADNGVYYSCVPGAGCGGSVAPEQDQVQNPVAHLPTDNNGVIIDLPAVGATGAASVEGQLLLGIGTQPNNAVSGASVILLDPSTATFVTVLDGKVMNGSFADTGSNGLFFPAPSSSALPACAAPASVWFCPSAAQSFTAVNSDGIHPGVSTPFQIDSFERLVATGNRVFNNLGGPALPSAAFDWGLPLFLGHPVALGYAGAGSTLGTGPLLAY